MYLAEGSKCSFTACWAALRFEASMEGRASRSVIVVDILVAVGTYRRGLGREASFALG